MKSIIFKKPGLYTYEERPKPKIKNPDDVLLKVLGVGICGTDLHILMDPPVHPAKPNIILGHEFCGEIAEVGTAVTPKLKIGDKAIVDPHPPCGKCENCISDRPGMCTVLYGTVGKEFPEYAGHSNTRGIFQDGALTSYICVPSYSVFKIKKETPFEIAALAEPLSCTGYSIEKLNIHPGDSVGVLGAGPIGLLFTCLAKASGASTVIVSEPSAYRRNKALKCGATRVVNPFKEDIIAIAMEETNGIGVDHCIEAVGAEIVTAIKVVRCEGKVLQFGHDETANPEIPIAELLKKEIVLFGGFLGKYYFEKTARIIESEILPLKEIVTHTFPLSRYQDALDLLNRREGIKVVIYPEEY
jgi:threonine dehydrogenase-like Zn-dependent dehydrogenase